MKKSNLKRKKRLNTKNKPNFFTDNCPIMKALFAEIKHNPVLSREEEVALFKAYNEKGDIKAWEKIIDSNQKFVVSVANKYINSINHSYLPDLINEGNLGLMEAAGKFDIRRGYKFITYAVWYIQRNVLAFLEKEVFLISKSNAQKTRNHIDKIKEKIRHLEEREPTNQEVIEILGVEHNVKIIDERDVHDVYYLSIDSPVNYYDESSDYNSVETEFNDMYYTQNDAVQKMDSEDAKILANEYLTILLPGEKKIVGLFYGVNEFSSYSLESIAEKYGYTTENIRQILKKAVEKLHTRSKISKIRGDIKEYLTFLTEFEVDVLDLHIRQKCTPLEIAKMTRVFSPYSIQDAICNAIDIVYGFYELKR